MSYLDINNYDFKTFKRCKNYLLNHYGNQEFGFSHVFWESPLYYKNTNQLNWKGESMDTHTWCTNYIGKWKYIANDRDWGGGSNSRKRQSKKKGLRLRKVSKKY